MGSSLYDHDVFATRAATHKSSHTSYFIHSAAIASGAAARKCHDDLLPSLVAGPKSPFAGKVMRESCDSDAHPASNAVMVLFDVTGSMGQVPIEFVEKFGGLMAMLTKKGYLADPQILFGAIGDAYSDTAPLQIGQFESGNEMDEALSKIWLEGGGGAQVTESYELAMYFAARHTALDCYTKRGKKAYLFLSGDELPYGHVSKEQVKRLIGDDLEADISLEDILTELRDKFEVFWIFPKQGSYWDDTRVNAKLASLFGQNLLKLEDAKDVCELISSTIGVCENYDVKSIEADLLSVGSSKSSVKNAITAITPYAASTALTRKTATVEGELPSVGADSIARI